MDGQKFGNIEAYGAERWLGELAERLRTKTYQPEAVKRVWIPKPNSDKKRPLGVPTITDRVVETAAMLVLEPIFEADLAPEQYAYRRDRGRTTLCERFIDCSIPGTRKSLTAIYRATLTVSRMRS